MNREQIIDTLKACFPDWEIGIAEQVADDVIKDFGIEAIDKFDALYWQEQDNIINVLQAIRGQ